MSKAIVDFLQQRFSADELRRLIRHNYSTLTPQLPGEPASLAQVADRFVALLEQHGLVDAVFFALLRTERGRFAAAIDALERAYSNALKAPPPKNATAKKATNAAKKAREPKTQGKAVYRWLHLTDIHFGARGRAAWVQVVEDFEHSLEEWLPKKVAWPIDLVLVTGDLTNQGARAEFDGVSAFFDRVLRRIAAKQGHEPLLVAVPGNHDLVRPKEDDALDFAAYDRYVQVGDAQGLRLHERLWTQEKPDRVAELFAEYSRWMDTYMLPKLATRASEVKVHRSFFPGDLTVTLTLPGRFPLGIVGLNSAWLQYQGGDFEEKLALPAEQFQAALPCPSGGSALDFFAGSVRQALLMHHHPPAWLSKHQQGIYSKALYVPRRFAACLFGHMHRGGAERRAMGGGPDRVYFQTPSLFGLEHYGQKQENRLFGYTFGQVREDGEVHAWPLTCVTTGNGEYRFVRDMTFTWHDDRYVILRQGS